MPQNAEAGVAIQHVAQALGGGCRSIRDERETRAFAIIGKAVDGHEVGPRCAVEQGIQDRPIGYRVAAVFHRFGLAVGGSHAACIEVVAAYDDRLRARPDVLILDARSESAFRAGHIAGAVNLPLTDFTAESLAGVVGRNRDRPILIYCNNNFSNNRAPVMLKARPLALNIQTFINLVGYGYRNVRALDAVIDFNDPQVRWVRG